MRLELIRPETLEPKSSASANSATPAKLGSNESWQARTADPLIKSQMLYQAEPFPVMVHPEGFEPSTF